MKDKILELIKAGEFTLARTLIKSQGLKINLREEANQAAKNNPYIVFINWDIYSFDAVARVSYWVIGKTDFPKSRCLAYDSHVLQFCLTWKGGRQ